MEGQPHPDRDSYNHIWDEVIWPEMQDYLKKYFGCVECIPQAQSAIWQRYSELNDYCKRNYMKSSDEKIDRHKVAACYMIAICSVQPMFVREEYKEKLGSTLAINETLAITVGLSVLRSFIIAAVRANKNDIYSTEEVEKLVKAFDGGIVVPPENMVNHGDYIENFSNELYYAVSEGKACILSFAHELYLLELFTRMSRGV